MAKRGGKRRDPAREKFWRRATRDQQRSGLSVRDFCRREGLKDWTFRWWRQELARRDRQPSAAPRGGGDAEPTEAPPAFLPVRVADLEVVSSRPAPPLGRPPLGLCPRLAPAGHRVALTARTR
jgi:hypothetical protein